MGIILPASCTVGTQVQIPLPCMQACGLSRLISMKHSMGSCNFLPKRLWLFSLNDIEMEPVSESLGSASQNLRLSSMTTTAYASELSGPYIIGQQHENPWQTAVSLHFCSPHVEAKAWPIFLIVTKSVMDSRESCWHACCHPLKAAQAVLHPRYLELPPLLSQVSVHAASPC